MIFTETNIYGFKFFQLKKELTLEDFTISIAKPREIKEVSDLKYLGDKITSTIYIELKDEDLKKQIIKFKRFELDQGARTIFELFKEISVPFNNKGKHSQKKLDLYNTTCIELDTIVEKIDTNKLIQELIDGLANLINKSNSKNEERLVTHFSKTSSFNFSKDDIGEAEQELEEAIKIVTEKKEALENAKKVVIQKDLQGDKKITEAQKVKILEALKSDTREEEGFFF